MLGSSALKQSCAGVLKRGGLGLGGGGGGRSANPPICKHSARMMGFKNTHMLGVICFETSLHGL